MLGAIDHTAIAVEDLDGAVAFYTDVLKLALVHRETVADQGIEAVLLDIGESHIELITPLDRADSSSSVAKFLHKRGPGLHHVAYRVDDIEAVLSKLTAAGVRLIDTAPRIGIRGSRVAFLHPSSSGGVLTEIVEPAGH